MAKSKHYATSKKHVLVNKLQWNVQYTEDGKQHEAVISIYPAEQSIEEYMLLYHPKATHIHFELIQSE